MLTLVSRNKLPSIGLVAFSFLMLLMLFLPAGFSSNLPNGYQLNQVCITSSTTFTAKTTVSTLTFGGGLGTGTSQVTTVSSTTDFPPTIPCTVTITSGTQTQLAVARVLLFLDLLLTKISSVVAVGGAILGISFAQVLLPLLVATALCSISVYTLVLRRRRKHK